MFVWVADENAALTDCYFAKKDWRACAAEVGLLACLVQAVAGRAVANAASGGRCRTLSSAGSGMGTMGARRPRTRDRGGQVYASLVHVARWDGI